MDLAKTTSMRDPHYPRKRALTAAHMEAALTRRRLSRRSEVMS